MTAKRIPKRHLINFCAYWLSLQSICETDYQIDAIGCRYIPRFLCSIKQMIRFVKEIYWSDVHKKRPEIALQILLTFKKPFLHLEHKNESYRKQVLETEYQTVLQQAQTLFEMFLRAVGSRGLRSFIDSHSTVTEPLIERFLALTTDSAKIYSMLCIMSSDFKNE